MHLEQILEMIAHIERRLDGLSLASFERHRDEVDLAAYRLATIGEATRKLSTGVKDRHPEIPWTATYGIRNIVAHEHGSVVPARVWNVADVHLADLTMVFAAELALLGN